MYTVGFGATISFEIAAQFIKDLSAISDGVVLIPLGWEKKVPAVLEEIGR